MGYVRDFDLCENFLTLICTWQHTCTSDFITLTLQSACSCSSRTNIISRFALTRHVVCSGRRSTTAEGWRERHEKPRRHMFNREYGRVSACGRGHPCGRRKQYWVTLHLQHTAHDEYAAPCEPRFFLHSAASILCLVQPMNSHTIASTSFRLSPLSDVPNR